MQRTAWVVADVPDGAKPHFDYGSALQKEGKLEEAVEQYDTAIQLSPKYAEAHLNLGSALSSQAKFDAAARIWKQRCGFNPTTAIFI